MKMLVDFSAQNTNGRTFEYASFSLPESGTLLGVLEHSTDTSNFVSIANVQMDSTGVYLQSIESTDKKLIDFIDNNNYVVRPGGIGTVDKDNVIRNFKLTQFSICKETIIDPDNKGYNNP